MKAIFTKWTSLVLTVIMLMTGFGMVATAAEENLLVDLNPGFEDDKPLTVDQAGQIIDNVAHTGSRSLAMNGGHIKYGQVPVKSEAKYTLSFWMQNSAQDAIRFYAANNAFLKDGNKQNPNGANYGSLPDMMFGEAHEGEDITVWREVKFSFIVPKDANMLNIAINANPDVDDVFLLVDDISLVENEITDTENLFAKYNPDFDGAPVSGIDLNGTITDSASHSGSHSFSMPTGHIKFGWFPIKPMTNYTLSFWMQNSKQDAIRFYASNNAFLFDGVKSGATLPDMVFGEACEGDDIAWREVRVNFTTPAGINMINIAINANVEANGEDPYLLVDDLSLVETGKDFGKLSNGDFEEPFIPEFYAFRPWSGISSYGLHVGLGEDSETGNHYLKLLDTAIGGEALEVWYPFSGLEGNRYKISFSQRFTNNGRPSLRFYTGDKPYFGEFPRASLDYIWEDYALYIHGAAPGAAGSLWFTSFDLDNVSIDVDENSLGFYKDIVLYTENAAGRHFPDPFGGATCTTEKTVKANALSEITPDANGLKSVSARAHVIPIEILDADGTGTGTYEKTEVMLFTGVYKYEDGKKSLIDFDVKTESSTDGKVLDPVTTVKVPANTDGVTYKVEAFTWNTAQGMQPALFDKAVLQ
ncbi:MAG: hypothetical protein E7408_06075 [Ruminococcaceae bacterium]|nr:hypothetical protein [Oscillospiraceae bacterium]